MMHGRYSHEKSVDMGQMIGPLLIVLGLLFKSSPRSNSNHGCLKVI